LAESQELVLHTFTFHKDGAFPFAGLSFDSKGNLGWLSTPPSMPSGSCLHYSVLTFWHC
jgi:hypothetical protein